MGNAIPEVINGAQFSQRQKDSFQPPKPWQTILHITNVKAVGPDGLTRDLAPIEVIIN